MADELARATDPATPADQLESLARTSADASVLGAIAANPNAPAALLLRLVAAQPRAFLQNPALPLMLLENPDFWLQIPYNGALSLLQSGALTAGQVKQLCPTDDHLYTYASALLGCPATPEEMLASIRVSSITEQQRLARHPNIPVGRLLAYLESDEPLLRREASMHPRTPPARLALLRRAGATADMAITDPFVATATEDELRQLAGGGYLGQLLVALNPRSPIDELEANPFFHKDVQLALLGHPRVTAHQLDRLVSSYTDSRKLPRPGPLPRTLDPEIKEEDRVQCAVARHPRTPPGALERLACNRSAAVRASVASRPELSPHTVNNLGLDDDPLVVLEALKNPALGAEVIEVIARYDPPGPIALEITRHGSAPRGVLRRLSGSPLPAVSEAARARLGEK